MAVPGNATNPIMTCWASTFQWACEAETLSMAKSTEHSARACELPADPAARGLQP